MQEYAQPVEVVTVQVLLLSPNRGYSCTRSVILRDAVSLVGVRRSTAIGTFIVPDVKPRLQERACHGQRGSNRPGQQTRRLLRLLDGQALRPMQNPGGISVSRVQGTRGVRIAYPAVQVTRNKTKRQVERLVYFDTQSLPITETLDAEDKGGGPSGGHVLYATFVESDHFLPASEAYRDALLYWIETRDGRMFARYRLVRDLTNWTVPRDLSVDVVNMRVLRHTWPAAGIGDYIKGAFFIEPGKEWNFLAQWPEQGRVHYTIVRVDLAPPSPPDPVEPPCHLDKPPLCV